MAKGWVSLREAQKLLPGFKHGWKFDRLRRRFHSPHGFVEQRVQLKPDGSPHFDRMISGEADNINAVVWGRRNDEIYIGVTIQARPFADNPDGTPADPPIVFGQPCAMGFNLARVAGEEAAIREAQEEAGTGSAIISVESMGYHNPNPTFCATWSELFAIEVDLDKIEKDKTDHTEGIYRAEYISPREFQARVAFGEHEGVNYRSATANDALFVWLAIRGNWSMKPEAVSIERISKIADEGEIVLDPRWNPDH